MKRIVLALIFVLFACLPSRAAIVNVQKIGFSLGNVNSPQSFAYSSNVTAGNHLSIIVGYGNTGGLVTVTDSLLQTWTKAKSQVQTSDGGDIELWYFENTAAGADTVTVTYVAAANVRAILLEYSGLAASGSLDQTNSAQADASSSINAGNVTTTQNDELMIAATRDDTNTTFTAGSGWVIETEVAAAPNTRLVYEDRIATVTGTYTGDMTSSGNLLWAAVIATFKGTGGGPPPCTPTLTLLGVGRCG